MLKSNKFKQGAMFGLDARIALAIFGALSVIAGAGLYSAVKKAQLTQIMTNIKEAEKAFSSYYVDTGVMPTLMDGANYPLSDLISSSEIGWKGPYLSYKPDSSWTDARYKNKMLSYTEDNCINLHLTEARVSDFDTTDGYSPVWECKANGDCDLYVTLWEKACNGLTFRRLAAELDEEFDNGDGLVSGNIRFNYNSYGNFMMIMFKSSLGRKMINK